MAKYVILISTSPRSVSSTFLINYIVPMAKRLMYLLLSAPEKGYPYCGALYQMV